MKPVASEDIRKGSGNGTVKSKDSSQEASGGGGGRILKITDRTGGVYERLGQSLELKPLQLEEDTIVTQSCTVQVQRKQSFVQSETCVPVNDS